MGQTRGRTTPPRQGDRLFATHRRHSAQGNQCPAADIRGTSNFIDDLLNDLGNRRARRDPLDGRSQRFAGGPRGGASGAGCDLRSALGLRCARRRPQGFALAQHPYCVRHARLAHRGQHLAHVADQARVRHRHAGLPEAWRMPIDAHRDARRPKPTRDRAIPFAPSVRGPRSPARRPRWRSNPSTAAAQ